MLILSVLFALVILGYLTDKTTSAFSGWGDFAAVVSCSSGTVLVAALLLIPLSRMGIEAEIEEYEAVRNTVENARETGSDIERAAFQMKVAEMNQWRASVRYWNGTVVDLWVPDDVESLEPIE